MELRMKNRHILALLVSAVLVSTGVCANPPNDPATTATNSYFMRIWAEDAEGKRVFDVGSASDVGERFSLTMGRIVGVILPAQPAQLASRGAAEQKGSSAATVQEVTIGVQWSSKLLSVQPDESYRAEMTWSWEPIQSRAESYIDRHTRNQTMRVGGKIGVQTLVGIMAEGQTPGWRIFVKLDRQPVAP